MWDLDTIWFDIAVVSSIMALGHILFGVFEERTPRLRKFMKFILTLMICISLSLFVSRWVMFLFIGIFGVMALYLHAIYLPKKGINGWTSEPKKKYYEFRGWDTDIFNDKTETE